MKIYFHCLLLILTIGMILMMACSGPSERGQVDESKPYLTVILHFNPDNYNTMAFSKMYPQFAVWIESKETGETETLYITEKAAENSWFTAEERPASLPVWYGIKAIEEDRQSLNIDAITSATPNGEMFTIRWQLPEAFFNQMINLNIEANISFDYNEYYPEEAEAEEQGYSDVNGQPSLIWQTELTTADENITIHDPHIVGTGSLLGEDHSIHPDLSSITTAKELFKKITIQYNKGND